ncbi:O-antigen ligase family protein [Halobacillus andaensis]|uniref:O-antigen ligase family protein n=1 Tax=Halobacillus andaensis TaxID=1176239 RepID=UPI001E3B6FAA|nr:O-antigen ligase family protein [Halobacillus andaensis]MBP2005809.1 O-antigen ligase [Halobacillus andaensis]
MGRTNGTIINQSIAAVGILFNLASLILYFAGLVKVRFLFEGDRIYEYGMMLDRDYPRLVGLMQDPNFFVFYNTIFFAYYLSNTKSTINKLGLALCIITNLLTFSRGGLLVMIILLAVYIVLNNPIKNIKLIVGIALSLVTTFIVLVNMNFNLYELLSSRVEASSEDGGSGRLVLWGRAWDYFTSNMYTGIGAFNFSDYNTFDYGDSLTVHNTFLDILAESGLLGIFFYMMFIAIVFAQLIRQKVHRTNSYLFLTFLGFVLQMGFLSVIINDIFFLYLAILSNHLNNHVILQKSKVHPESMSPLRGGVYDERFITDR